MKNVFGILPMLIMAVIFIGCESDESTEDNQEGVWIGEKQFEPDTVSVIKRNESFSIYLKDGSIQIEAETNAANTGEYLVVNEFNNSGSEVRVKVYENQTKYDVQGGKFNVVSVDNYGFSFSCEILFLKGTEEVKFWTKAYSIGSKNILDSISLIVYGEGVEDIDGNKYKSVIIGDQEWMAENIKVTKTKEGVEIPYVEENQNWMLLKDDFSDMAYCINPDFIEFNAYYTYAAAKEVCPDGWHFPTQQDWRTLGFYLEGNGYKPSSSLKSKTGWDEYEGVSGNGLDLFGFNALPSGVRDDYVNGDFVEEGDAAMWWSTIDEGGGSPLIARLWGNEDHYLLYQSVITKSLGYPVRCIKNKD